MTEVAIEEILDNKEDKNRTFDKKKVKEIRKAWLKGGYEPNGRLIAEVLFSS